MYLGENTLLQGGKYKIIRYISRGGFGCTYEAQNVMLCNQVAIKELFVGDFCVRDSVTGQVSVFTEAKRPLFDKLCRKFIDEARAIASLIHSGIVRVTDVFIENGTAYYVMDYIDGYSLRDLVKRDGALSEQIALLYIRQVADALQYVHGKNRLHLDIKPANIMVNSEGKAILIDFGVSKQYDEESGENTSSVVGHSPGYAPPEQANNKIGKFLPATDIYALGATLYNLLTGIVPPTSIELAAGEELPPIPATVSQATRRAVEESVILNKLARPQSVTEFLAILDSGKPSKQTTTTHAKVDDNEKTVIIDANKTIYPETQPSTNSHNGHEWVDLGLSVKWATCNVGAQRPEEYGNYYAWGGTNTKREYLDINSATYKKHFSDIGGSLQYDAARVNWGGSWRMPTRAECEELIKECTWQWTSQNGVNGYRVTSKKNGNSIFLPAAGWRNGSSLYHAGEYGYYWSSTPYESGTEGAYSLGFSSSNHRVVWSYRYGGHTVRPVCGSLENEQPRQAQDEGRDAPVVRNDANDKKAEQERWRNLIPMVYVQGGTFTMGATSEQGRDAWNSEKPAHSVTVGSFYMGKYEVTQAQWEAVMGSNPSHFKGSNLPVECVSYDEAKAFCRKLSELTGRTYRLPTEAEWEYAARGGNRSQGYKYSGSNNIDEVAWYDGNSGSTTHAVGSKRANELGLHDMSGNVWEWCSDWYDKNYYSTSPQHNPKGASSGSYRVLRGGSWYYNAQNCRVSFRDLNTPSRRCNSGGFRVVCVP